MSHPVLVLRPPARRGRQLALSADLLLGGDDQVTVSALIGPDTQRWVARHGRAALGNMSHRLDRAKKLIGRYIKIEGNWGHVAGDLGALGFDVISGAAAIPRIAGPSEVADAAANHYLAMAGHFGPDAQAQAQADWDDPGIVGTDGSFRNPAVLHRHLVGVADAIMSGRPPHDDVELDICRALDRVAGACCDECAKGHECEGEKCSPALPIDFDIEEAVLLPDETAGRVGNAVADAAGYRSFSRVAPRLSVQEAAKRVRSLCGACG